MNDFFVALLDELVELLGLLLELLRERLAHPLVLGLEALG